MLTGKMLILGGTRFVGLGSGSQTRKRLAEAV